MRAMLRLVMVSIIAVVVVALAIINVPAPVHARRPQVAIIGGGIGGAATAHFLRRLVGHRVAIHVYERERVGGRIKSTPEIEGLTHELGGSMLYEENYYVRSLADDMTLQRVDPGKEAGLENTPFALFDGREFVFNQSAWEIVNIARMFMRYGTAPMRFQGKPRAFFERFKGIYDLQANGTAFHSPEELLKRVGLYDLTQTSMHRQLAETLGTDERTQRFAAEFVASVNRVNYNQDNTLNAFAGMASMLPATDSRIFKIRGGNQQLPERLLQAAGVHLKTGWAVTEVRAAKGCRLELHARHPHGGGGGAGRLRAASLLRWDQVVAGPYDAVVVAAPLEHSAIRFHGVGARILPRREFRKVSTTFVAGHLRASCWNVTVLPADQVLTTEHAGTPFTVVSPLRRLPSGRTLYKMFSPRPLHHRLLDAMFQNHTKVAHQDWLAYPQFHPPEKFAPFHLAPGIFYNNALESAASAMEMSAIAAKNSALLVLKHLTGQDGSGLTAAT